MNTASQDLPRHLDLLQQKLQHGTDYELALIPGVKGGTEVARFRPTGGLASNPKLN